MPARLEVVLEAIYVAHALDWMAGEDLTPEAFCLTGLPIHMLPEEPEMLGPAVLLTASETRAAARKGLGYASLEEQEPVE